MTLDIELEQGTFALLALEIGVRGWELGAGGWGLGVRRSPLGKGYSERASDMVSTVFFLTTAYH